MRCDCGGDTVVKETRTFGNKIYRRRRCLTCNAVLFTREEIIPSDVGRRGIQQGAECYNVKRGR